ncbi:DUF362 domain-containing protein, partial [Candidatus Woesearchaeota archaeon]|nr:DUF362 domain-containing protein [Candidatus Woesearchaeota archaeon]
IAYQKYLPRDKELILKLNLSWSLYYPACSTQPWQLEGVLKTLIEDGYKKIHPVENKTVVTKPWLGAKQNKWLPILEKYSLRYKPLTEVEWSKYKLKKAKLETIHRIFPEGHEIPAFFIGKNVVHLPTFKCHGHTTITGAIKDAFGGLITEKRHHCHKMIHEVLVDLLILEKEIHPGIFAVMDGTVCGNGPGPRTMIPVIKNYIAASADQVAIDAIEAKMFGFEPMSIPFIKMAHDKGLGCGDVEQIEIIGEDIAKENFHFKTKRSPVVFWDQMLRKKIPFIEHILFHTKLFNLCIMASGIYHDKFWYNLVGKRRIKEFMKSEWGQLFLKY